MFLFLYDVFINWSKLISIRTYLENAHKELVYITYFLHPCSISFWVVYSTPIVIIRVVPYIISMSSYFVNVYCSSVSVFLCWEILVSACYSEKYTMVHKRWQRIVNRINLYIEGIFLERIMSSLFISSSICEHFGSHNLLTYRNA